MVRIRSYRSTDRGEWLRMRRELWPEIPVGEEEQHDADEWLSSEHTAVIVAQREGQDGLAGFAEVGERLYADGCDTSPVAFLEGWYVDPEMRKLHVGRDLVIAAEVWARQKGYRELASDSLLEDLVSYKAHLAVGFDVVERAIRYRKSLE